MKLSELGSGCGTVALCERCGEEITVANDLDLAGDVDRRRHQVMVAGKPRPQPIGRYSCCSTGTAAMSSCTTIASTPNSPRDRPSAELIREHMRQLRKVLAGSRYQIVNYRSIGYELIVADTSDAPATAPAGRPRAMGG